MLAMVFISLLTLLITTWINIYLISWALSDIKIFETKIEEWKEEVRDEIKYFHGRMCFIEALMTIYRTDK